MNNYPDTVGFLLGEALNKIEKLGFEEPIIKITSQPKAAIEKYDGDFRVLRQKKNDKGIIELIVGTPDLLKKIR